jgi:tRNA(fMet)-specific endonuclease VapC
MKYLLDTNSCIRYLNGRSEVLVRRLDAIDPSEVVVCSLVKFELYSGSLRSQRVFTNFEEQNRFLDQFKSLPFDDAAALSAAHVRADLATQGQPIGPYDLLIAGIALSCRLIVVTHNTKEFSRVAGLQWEDWEAIP